MPTVGLTRFRGSHPYDVQVQRCQVKGSRRKGKKEENEMQIQRCQAKYRVSKKKEQKRKVVFCIGR
jgi:hypothetical protein